MCEILSLKKIYSFLAIGRDNMFQFLIFNYDVNFMGFEIQKEIHGGWFLEKTILEVFFFCF